MLVRYWMTENPATVTEDTSLLRALEIMRDRKVRRLPVVRGTELCGILSVSDLYRYVEPIVTIKKTIPELAVEELAPRSVSQVMIPSPLTVEPNTWLEDVAELMRKNKVGAVPVVKDSELVGIITETDVFSALTQLAHLGETGQRVCFRLPVERKKEVFYNLVELCEQHDVDLLTVMTHAVEAEKSHMVMLRFRGGDSDNLVEALWQSEYQVLQVG